MKKSSGIFDLVQPGFTRARPRHSTQAAPEDVEPSIVPIVLVVFLLGVGIGLLATRFL